MADETFQSLDEAIERIDEAIFDEEFDRATSLLREALDQLDDAPELCVLEAELAYEQDQFEQCVEICEARLGEWHELGDEAPDAYVAELLAFKAYSLFYLDADERAREVFNDAVRQDPESWMAILGRATVHEFQGYLRAALLDLDRAIWLDDQEPEPFALRGSVHLQLGNHDDAERDFGYAIDIDPYDEEARLNLARLQALDGRRGEATETLAPLVDEGVDPMFVVPGALLRSQLAVGLGSTDAAIADAEVAIEHEPEKPWGYLQRAAAQLMAGSAGDAIATLKEAESRIDNPRSVPDLHSLRASAYQKLDKPEKAQEQMDLVEGAARLPAIVYGDYLNPAKNIPVNPERPLDVETILTEVFGDPADAPAGYKQKVRSLLDRLPEIAEEQRQQGRDQLEIELPSLPGSDQSPGSLVLATQPAG